MSAYACSDPDFVLIAISALQDDPNYPIDRGRLAAVRAAMLSGEPLAALVCRRWGGKLFLVDGWHRRAVAAELGHDTVPVRLLPPP
jgi:hypothetical protein